MKLLSLGYHCQPITTLYRLSEMDCIQNPFQNMVSYDLSKLIHVFKNNFENFFEETEVAKYEYDNNFLKVKDIQNHITSIHDFIYFKDYLIVKNELKTSGLNMIEKIKKKDEMILIFRKNQTSEPFESSIELYKYLKSLRKSKPFILTIFQNQDFSSKYKNLYFIKEEEWFFDLEKKDWIGDEKAWMRHLKFLWNRTYCL